MGSDDGCVRAGRRRQMDLQLPFLLFGNNLYELDRRRESARRRSAPLQGS